MSILWQCLMNLGIDKCPKEDFFLLFMIRNKLRQHENMIVAKLIKRVPEKTWTVI